CREAYRSEEQVIEWIYEAGNLDFLPKETVKEFVKHRLNNSLKSIGYDAVFEVDEKAVESTDWFEDELNSTKHVDFFVKRSVNYTKRSRSIGADDLFGDEEEQEVKDTFKRIGRNPEYRSHSNVRPNY